MIYGGPALFPTPACVHLLIIHLRKLWIKISILRTCVFQGRRPAVAKGMLSPVRSKENNSQIPYRGSCLRETGVLSEEFQINTPIQVIFFVLLEKIGRVNEIPPNHHPKRAELGEAPQSSQGRLAGGERGTQHPPPGAETAPQARPRQQSVGRPSGK